MNERLNNEGLTLVEVLAVVVLLSFVFLLIASTQLFGQREYNTQSEKIMNEESVQFLIKDITREIRKVDDNSKIKIGTTHTVLSIGDVVYSLQDNELKKNDSVWATDISDFNVKFNPARDTLSILIVSNGSSRTSDHLQTSIYLREGD
ncbi:hypothetical protein [Sporosarcina aquimarina]|uniref:Prepilin-type N-terminal cleavage/methylation domain-containing protein n=1 Tax=Sporosarcina aquimarina TaxID=114975 RepID=A0ABU4FY73_9BACL|nr:hypothetical protein [Sporosarcina aquimarina]MDW0109651.1 hypothetical protein [Sporosarcina aquimarina]